MKQRGFPERSFLSVQFGIREKLGLVIGWYAVCATLGWFLLAGTNVAQAAPLASTPASWQKSVSMQSRWADDWGSASSDAAIEQAYRANANHLTLIIPFQQDNISSNFIYKSGAAPTDVALVHAINKAHSLGMGVTIKPHVDPKDGHWRADISPPDRNGWFSNYASMLNSYATLAQQNRVEQIMVGAELISMSTFTSNSDNTQRWRSLIAGVRQRFSGKLTYSANWGGNFYAEEFTHIGFWDALDYVGISAYFELATYNNPSVSQLMDSWNYYNTNKIQPFQQSQNKPVLFTEVGYRSVDGAAQHPWDSQRPGAYNSQEQVNGITAMTQFWSSIPWMAGIQYWSWISDANCCGAGDTGYEPQNKPGYDALKTGFDSGNVVPTPLTFSTSGISVAPSSGPAGTNFALNASFKASTAATVIIDMEVYNASGQKIYQQYAASQSFNAGQTRNYTFNWASPSNQAQGEYSLTLGVFSNDNQWSTSYLWQANAFAFAVSTGSPAPTPTATATFTPTATARPATATPKPATATAAAATATATATARATATATARATATPVPPTSGTLEVWWPADNGTLSGLQIMKARMSNLDLSQYNMYWQVDNGQPVYMDNQSADGGYKYANVDVSGWYWNGNGPYLLNFVAKDASGNIIQQRSVQIFVQH